MSIAEILNRSGSSHLCKVFIPFFTAASVLISCGDGSGERNLKSHYLNDFECYEGWVGIDGYYNLKSGDSHSGQFAVYTDSSKAYSITYSRNLNALSPVPIKKFYLSVWVKCLGLPAKGAYIMTLERQGEILNYFSFDLKEKDAKINEWMQLKGEIEMPQVQPKHVIVKIYFWNKGQSPILVDDVQFSYET